MTRAAAFLSSSVALTLYHHVRMPKPDKNIKLKDSRQGDIIENIPTKLNKQMGCDSTCPGSNAGYKAVTSLQTGR